MLAVVNPEAIGVFGLMVTVLVFGMEQVGIGIKGADGKEISKSLAYIAIVFGGTTQVFTALAMYLFSVAGEKSVYLGTVFGFFGLFWILFERGRQETICAFFCGKLVLGSDFLNHCMEVCFTMVFYYRTYFDFGTISCIGSGMVWERCHLYKNRRGYQYFNWIVSDSDFVKCVRVIK